MWKQHVRLPCHPPLLAYTSWIGCNLKPKLRRLETVKPSLALDVDFFPGIAKSWGFSFMINDEPAPTGRPAGAGGWAGLGNLYYWFDRENGVAGFWATQLFPFMDPTSLQGFLAFETAVYQALARRRP